MSNKYAQPYNYFGAKASENCSRTHFLYKVSQCDSKSCQRTQIFLRVPKYFFSINFCQLCLFCILVLHGLLKFPKKCWNLLRGYLCVISHANCLYNSLTCTISVSAACTIPVRAACTIPLRNWSLKSRNKWLREITLICSLLTTNPLDYMYAPLILFPILIHRIRPALKNTPIPYLNSRGSTLPLGSLDNPITTKVDVAPIQEPDFQLNFDSWITFFPLLRLYSGTYFDWTTLLLYSPLNFFLPLYD